jgi:hypothetical protein
VDIVRGSHRTRQIDSAGEPRIDAGKPYLGASGALSRAHARYSAPVSTQVAQPATAGVEVPPPAPQISATEPANWRRSWWIGFATWAGGAMMCATVTALSFMIDDVRGPAIVKLYEIWDHWDTGHYMRIANLGYTADRPDTHAFFPLYPLLVRGVDTLLPGPTLVATLVVANVACVGALAVLHHFVTHEFGGTLADRVLLVLMAWPAAFFLTAGYNTSLFLLLSVATLYCIRRQAWWAAGVLGALASATRLSGVLLVLPFAVEYLRIRGWRLRDVRADALAVLLVPVGLGLFSTYCWLALGDPFAFSRAQDHWGREFAAPWAGLAEAIGSVVVHPLLHPFTLHNLIDALSAIVAVTLLVLAWVGRWRLGPEHLYLQVYAAAALLLVLTGPVAGLFPLQGLPRYVIELVPAFLVLGRLAASRAFERVYLLPAVGIQVVFLLTFLNNVWVS